MCTAVQTSWTTPSFGSARQGSTLGVDREPRSEQLSFTFLLGAYFFCPIRNNINLNWNSGYVNISVICSVVKGGEWRDVPYLVKPCQSCSNYVFRSALEISFSPSCYTCAHTHTHRALLGAGSVRCFSRRHSIYIQKLFYLRLKKGGIRINSKFSLFTGKASGKWFQC